MSMTYNLENPKIDIPRAQSPSGRELYSEKRALNGRIVITTKMYQVVALKDIC
jgi:hypothetical protein